MAVPKKDLSSHWKEKQAKYCGNIKIGNSLISTVVPLNGHEVLFTATSGEVGLLRIKN